MTVPTRTVDDPRTIRALAHPLRLALLQLLMVRGPLTATEAGEALGETPASASFHLRTLHRYGYVEEAAAGPGRRRPWRAVRTVQRIPESQLRSEAGLASDELSRALSGHVEQLHDEWRHRRRGEPAQWQGAAEETTALLRLTPDEAARLGEELHELLSRWAFAIEREPASDDARRTVLLSLRAFPLAADGR
jgi:DNA-binding transcriptional ArsR family regulator